MGTARDVSTSKKALGPCADAKAGSRPATALRPPGSSHGKGVLPAPASASEEQGFEIVAHRGSLTGGPGTVVPAQAGTDLAGAGPVAGVKPTEPSFTTEDSSAADGSDAASMVGAEGGGGVAGAWAAAGGHGIAQRSQGLLPAALTFAA